MELIILLAVVLAAVGVWIYNRLVRGRNYVKDAWAGIEVQLTKRHDLIPLLVTVVKQYAKHESKLFSKVASLRAPKISGEIKQTQTEEQSFGDQFLKLFALSEDYPDLKADENFQRLQDQLVAVEGDIESARRYYNGSVRDYRVLLESFPSNLVAGWFGFVSVDFFELKLKAARIAPEVNLGES